MEEDSSSGRSGKPVAKRAYGKSRIKRTSEYEEIFTIRNCGGIDEVSVTNFLSVSLSLSLALSLSFTSETRKPLCKPQNPQTLNTLNLLFRLLLFALDKAMAKFVGSYANLSGGTEPFALMALTGPLFEVRV